MEYQKRILETFLPLYFQCLNENYSDKINTSTINQTQSHHPLILSKIPTFFIVRILTCLNQIPIYPDEKELEEKDFEKFREIAGNKL